MEAKVKVDYQNGSYDPMNIQMVIDRIVEIGAVLGVHFKGYTPLSLSLFNLLPKMSQKVILEQLNNYADTISITDPQLPKNRNEENFLREVCKKLGISIPEDFYGSICGNEIIEIYRLDEGIQIYRNLEFMKYSTYDFATVLVHSWEELFQRPEEVHSLMAERAKVVVTTAENTKPWDLPKHELIERMHPQLNAFEMEMLKIAPGIDIKTNTRAFWISSLKVKPLGSCYQGSRNIRAI